MKYKLFINEDGYLMNTCTLINHYDKDGILNTDVKIGSESCSECKHFINSNMYEYVYKEPTTYNKLWVSCSKITEYYRIEKLKTIL